MSLYRYRTDVLVGAWRAKREQAIEDAVLAGQARFNEALELEWLVPGEIEEQVRKAA
ncbi:MAG: hypothetical protein ACT4N8_06800 [Sphingosinicella sp.]|uniref:hypothetical protein n=1 Tax=Sphingosinicella sp. TaxID=1917971 RepID=UPI0040378AD5